LFNNREIAAAISLTLFAIWVLTKSDLRHSIASVYRAFLNWKILACVAGMVLYTATIVTLLHAVGFWELGMLKDTVLWLCFAAFAMVMRFMTSRDNERILRQVFVDNVKVVILIEFLIGTYVMSLPAELVFVPLVTFLVMLDAFARCDDKYAPVVKLTGLLLAVIGCAILGFAVSRAIGDWRDLGTMNTVRSIVFPPLMCLVFAPFIYVVVVIATYESIFIRLTLGRDKTADVVRYAKRRILLHYGLSLRRLRDFAKRPPFEIMQIQTTDDVDRLLKSA
jgi:hypothetical protein